jgi:primosomal protein N' (replication factor Y)
LIRLIVLTIAIVIGKPDRFGHLRVLARSAISGSRLSFGSLMPSTLPAIRADGVAVDRTKGYNRPGARRILLHQPDMPQKRIRVAVPVPVPEGFDYLWDRPEPPPAPGTRVKVPFGKRQRIGVVIDARAPSALPDSALKAVVEVLDPEPLIGPELMQTLHWAADYYHHPIGEVLQAALPTLLREGRPARAAAEPVLALSGDLDAAGIEALRRRAPRQLEALKLLEQRGQATAAALVEAGAARAAIQRLQTRGWIVATAGVEPPAAHAIEACDAERAAPPTLTPDQDTAVSAMLAATGFEAQLLYGVTGSGKTEVFLRLIDAALQRDQQCLLLVPEIGLTPQLVARLGERFGGGLVVFHSGLTPTERLAAWREAHAGRARLIVGTRSGVFAPLPRPGLIVVDEEHDPSYKQQSGFRYSGRDLAIMRAKALDVPILLASATPSLESYRNAMLGRYRLMSLPKRIGAGGEPSLRIIDLNRHAVRQGLSTPLLASMERHLQAGHQVLLFINRRGFAPVLFCPGCERAVDCPRCDARMTVHASAGQLRCHHCGRSEALRWACPTCGGERIAVGAGTQRVTTELQALYPDTVIARMDRDAVGGRDALGRALSDIEAGHARIIVGTQLLTKGHDFPDVTLVGILNADQGLFGADFRSEERLAQTIVQVAGRAGRRDRQGEVLIQTHYPSHPLLGILLDKGYGAFAEHALAEREATGWPPYRHLAVFRAEAADRNRVFAVLRHLKRHCQSVSKVEALGPTPDWIERRQGRYRAQLLLKSSARNELHRTIDSALTELAHFKPSRQVRWSIDVDPSEL